MSDEALLREIRDTVVETKVLLAAHIAQDEKDFARLANHVNELYKRADESARFRAQAKGAGLLLSTALVVTTLWDKIVGLIK